MNYIIGCDDIIPIGEEDNTWYSAGGGSNCLALRGFRLRCGSGGATVFADLDSFFHRYWNCGPGSFPWWC